MANLFSIAFLGGSSIGSGEVLLLLILILVLFGPKRLPELARTLGRFLGELRKASSDFQRSMMTADLPPPPDPKGVKASVAPALPETVKPPQVPSPAPPVDPKPEGRPDDPA